MAVKLRLLIPRKAVSINATYKRGRGNRLYMSAEGCAFKDAVRAHAFAAVQSMPTWPKPERVKAVKVRIVTNGSRHDADACTKLVLDSMEGSVYANDRCVREVSAAKGTGLKPSVEVEVELLEVA